MYIKEIVEVFFHSIIVQYKLRIEDKSKNEIKLLGKNYSINIDCFFGEVYVTIDIIDLDIKIKPILWAYCLNKVDFKNSINTSYPTNLKLKDIVKYNLFLESTYIRLFCGELLNEDFSNINVYKNKKDIILKKRNEYYESKQ